MVKISILFQILSKSIFYPQLISELIKERKEIQEDERYKKHQYKHDFSTVKEFTNQLFPNINLNEYEKELKILEADVDDYFKKLESEKFPSKKKPYPVEYSINPDSRRLLYYICRILKPKYIIETGVAYGLSSLYILKALNDNGIGTLYSIDSVFRPWQSKEMIGNIIPDKLKKRWNFIYGKSVDELPNLLESINNVDMFIHDSLHTYRNMMFEFESVFKKIKENGWIISDDICGNDAFFDFTKKMNVENYIIKIDDESGIGIMKKQHV